jgi:predicted PurR-regulated permease PerM
MGFDMGKTRRLRRTGGVVTRERGKIFVVGGATIVCVYVCFRLAQPFIPALVFSVTAAVITQPLVNWVAPYIVSKSLRAAAGVAIVTAVILAPIVAMVYFVSIQIAQGVQNWQSYLTRWQQFVDRQPRMAAAWDRISTNLNVSGAVEQFAGTVNQAAMSLATASGYSVFQALVTLYLLFFIYRDGDYLLKSAKQISPLTSRETNRLLSRLHDTIYATVLGVVMVSIIQGALGGIIFALLGIPGAVLWATVMALFAMVPNLGAFVVWGPAALLLFLDGQWGKGTVLTLYGLTAIALIDNLLYPMLVGNRLRQHTIVAFISILGGIFLFGAAGIVLGPVIVTLTFFLLELWRRRTEDGRAAETATLEAR